MRTIGITGGIGAGKSALLSYVKAHYNCRVIIADEVAHRVKEPGQECYKALVRLLGDDILTPERNINKEKMAERMFADERLLEEINGLIHPAVKHYIEQVIETEKRENRLDFLFVEAALLIEDGYRNILDEIWYLHADTAVRKRRLKESRAYSDEKIDLILSRQLPEEAFRESCQVLIDNSGDLEETYRQMNEKLEGYL